MHKFLLVLLLILTFDKANAAEASDLFEMSLEELLTVKIVTVSKKEELIEDAPGVVSVITSEDILRFGARNLRDVLLRIPNYYIFDSLALSSNGSTMRAGATQHLNNHVLYLINGRPLRESQNGGRQTDINLLFPVSAIERIEVIRGPGSVLYGSNAFNGTINIITKTASTSFDVGVEGVVGSFGYRSVDVSTGHSSEDAQINAQVKLLNEDGATLGAFDSTNTFGETTLYREGYFGRIDGSYKRFSVEGMFSEIQLPNISGAFNWNGLDEWTHQRNYINLGYKYSFNDDWSSTINATYNNVDMTIISPTAVSYSSFGYMYEITVNGRINDKTSVVLGAVEDHIKGDLDIRGGEINTLRNSIYGQIDYYISGNTRLTAGLQHNKPEAQSAHTSPRFALVHKFNQHWSGKLLYADAFRSPYGAELNFSSGFLRGDMNLKPENITTAEAQLTYTQNNATVSTTLYHSKSSDLIGRRRIDGTTFFVNLAQEIIYEGIELEGRWEITPKLQLNGNASYQKNEDDQGHTDVMIAPNQMIKVGLSYNSDAGVTASVWASYFGASSKLEEMPGVNVVVVNPPADAFNLVSVNVLADLGEWFNSESLKDVRASLFIDNVFDEDVWFPEMGQRSVNSYPQSHSRSVFLNISVDI